MGKFDRIQSQDERMDNMRHQLQDERQEFQKRIFTHWLNSKLIKADGTPQITDLFLDLRNGLYLLKLVGVLTGRNIKPEKGNSRVHHIANITASIDVFKEYKIKFVGTNNDSIADGDRVTTLGLCWKIIYRFQIIEALTQSGEDSAEKQLLNWCKEIVSEYSSGNVKDFQPKRWRDGFIFNAILHAYNPELFQYSDLNKMDDSGRLENAIHFAQNCYEVTPLFQPKDFENDAVDRNTVMMYIAILHEKLKKFTPASKKDDLLEALHSKIQELNKSVRTVESDSMFTNPLESSLNDLCKRYNEVHKLEKVLTEHQENLSSLDEEFSSILKIREVSEVKKNELEKGLQNVDTSLKKLCQDTEQLKKSLLSKLSDMIATEFNKINSLLKKFESDSSQIQDFLSADYEHSVEQWKQNMKQCNAIVEQMDKIKPLVDFNKSLISKIFDANSIPGSLDVQGLETSSNYSKLHTSLLEQQKVLGRRLEDIKNHQDKQVQEWIESAEEMVNLLDQAESFQLEIELESSLPTKEKFQKQELLHQKLNEAQPRKNGILSDGQSLNLAIHDQQRSEQIKESMLTLEQRWNEVFNKSSQELQRLGLRLEDIRNHQDKQVQKWIESAEEMVHLLDQTESEQLEILQESSLSTMERLQKLEILQEKLKEAQPRKNDISSEGQSLNLAIHDQQRSEQIKESMLTLEQRWNEVFNKSSQELQRFQKQYSNQVELYNQWLGSAASVKEYLHGYEISHGNTRWESLEDVQCELRKQENLLKSFKGYKKKMLSVLENGKTLLPDLSEEKCSLVNEEMQNIHKVWEEVLQALTTHLIRVNSAKDQLEKELLADWYTRADQIKLTFDDYERQQNEGAESHHERGEKLQQQQIWVDRIAEMEPQVQNLLTDGTQLRTFLTADTKAAIEVERSFIENKWMLIKDNVHTDLHKCEKALAEFTDMDAKMDDVLNRIDEFNDWMHLAITQIENVNVGNSFPDLIQKEIGLKKLSSDMDQQSVKMEEFVNISNELKNSGDRSEKKLKIIDRINVIESEWNNVIDLIDGQFKSLYDAINTSLDTNRNQVSKYLELLEENISKLDSADVSDQRVIGDCKKISELECEVSKLKVPISVLNQYVGSLSNVTLLQDSEKDHFQQCCVGLTERHNRVQTQLQDLRKRFRNNMMSYIEQEIENVVLKIREIDQKQPIFDFDEENGEILREHLTKEKGLSNELKVEHFKMEAVEQFAEQISLQKMLSSSDQMAIAELINNALKKMDDLKNALKTHFHRAYAVYIHILKQRILGNKENLTKLDESVEHLQQESRNFDDLANSLDSIKGCEDTMKAITNDISCLTSEINKLTKDDILDQSDASLLQNKASELSNQSVESSELISTQTVRLREDVNKLFKHKLDEFYGWLPLMQKRSKESDEIGPDMITIKKQLQEMKVIEQQSAEKTLMCLNDEKHRLVVDSLREDCVEELRSANQEWEPTMNWLNNRTKKLEDTATTWDDFNKQHADLLEFLKEKEREMIIWNQLDLNDPESVAYQQDVLDQVLKSMELRRAHVGLLADICDKLVSGIAKENSIADNLFSKVKDVHDIWNAVLKKTIENRFKLKNAQEKLLNLEMDLDILRDWIDKATELLEDLTTKNEFSEVDFSKIKDKEAEMIKMGNLLDEANMTNNELTEDELFRLHFTIDNISTVNIDFERVTRDLIAMKDLSSKTPFMRWIHKKIFFNKT